MRKVIVTQGFYPATLKRLRELSVKTGVPVNQLIELAVCEYLPMVDAADQPDGNLETPAILREVTK